MNQLVPPLRILLTAMLLACAVALGGCGGDDGDSKTSGTGGSAAGKKLFAEKCGSCHVLADAGTNGSFGPNLDESRPDAARVEAQIAAGGGGMPSALVTGTDAEAVASYVESAAGT